MEILIRAARQDDAPSIVALLNPIIAAGTYTVMDEPCTLEGQLDYMARFPERGVLNVAVEAEGGTVVGVQGVERLAGPGPFAHVGDVSTFVALAALRRGVGRQLSRVTFADAAGAGFAKLWASIRADNPAAVAFYASQGFRIVGIARRHARVAGRDVDEVLAERLLD